MPGARRLELPTSRYRHLAPSLPAWADADAKDTAIRTAEPGEDPAESSRVVAKRPRSSETKVTRADEGRTTSFEMKARNTNDVFEREFLPIRAKLLEIASALDRLDRADGPLDAESRRKQMTAAIQVLLQSGDDRAEQIQLIFSRPYEDDWREKLRMAAR
jgi:hypothetical protein